MTWWTWLLLGGTTWFLGSTLLAVLVGSAIRSAESFDHAHPDARAGRASCRRSGHPRFCHTHNQPGPTARRPTARSVRVRATRRDGSP